MLGHVSNGLGTDDPKQIQNSPSVPCTLFNRFIALAHQLLPPRFSTDYTQAVSQEVLCSLATVA